MEGYYVIFEPCLKFLCCRLIPPREILGNPRRFVIPVWKIRIEAFGVSDKRCGFVRVAGVNQVIGQFSKAVRIVRFEGNRLS